MNEPVLRNGMYYCPVCNKQLQFASNDASNTEYLRCPSDYSHCKTISMSNPDSKGYRLYMGSRNSSLSDWHDRIYGEDD